MTAKIKILLPIFLVWFLSSGVTAEDIHNGTSTNDDSLEYTLPEITVEGDTSMHSLRMEVIHAEELKFEIFNNLNSTDEFDITCRWHAPLGTKIKKWGCDVRYMEDITADDGADFHHSLLRPEGSGPSAPLVTRGQRSVQFANKTRALNREMKALAVKHPELAIAIINAHELEQLYKEESKRRHKDSILTGQTKSNLVLNKIDIWEAAFQDHSNGVMSDSIWARWDSMYRKLFNIKTYQRLWQSVNQDKYSGEFIEYVNTIVSDQ